MTNPGVGRRARRLPASQAKSRPAAARKRKPAGDDTPAPAPAFAPNPAPAKASAAQIDAARRAAGYVPPPPGCTPTPAPAPAPAPKKRKAPAATVPRENAARMPVTAGGMARMARARMAAGYTPEILRMSLEKGGLEFERTDDGAFVVTRDWCHSEGPSRSRPLAGDTIVSINDVVVSGMAVEDVQDLIHGTPGLNANGKGEADGASLLRLELARFGTRTTPSKGGTSTALAKVLEKIASEKAAREAKESEAKAAAKRRESIANRYNRFEGRPEITAAYGVKVKAIMKRKEAERELEEARRALQAAEEKEREAQAQLEAADSTLKDEKFPWCKWDDDWVEGFQCFVRYKDLHRTATASKTYKGLGGRKLHLGAWASTQRASYRERNRKRGNIDVENTNPKKGKFKPMKEWRLKLLEDAGFDLGDPNPQKYLPNKTWEERYSDLLEYRRLHGTVDVPMTKVSFSGPDGELAGWVKSQRKLYRARVEGRAKTLTDERIRLLNEAGFTWRLKHKSKHRKRGDVMDGKGGDDSDASEDDDESSSDGEDHHAEGSKDYMI